jgi:NAD(P)-dependent dehydrogenase (short-subunit alcohol dehydrogenase family)
MTGSLLDSVLDRSVIGGYTSIGYRIRSRGWTTSELPSLSGRAVMVTGATSGIGLAAAEGFARLGATVWLVVRSQARGEQARAAILERSASKDVHVGLCDLSDLASVGQFAERFAAQAERLDVLVSNAGVLTEERRVSTDGIELTFATNVLGPFLLMNLLLPLLERSAPARIINVSSGGMYTQRIRVDDLQSERGEFDGPTAYARTKRCAGHAHRDLGATPRGPRRGRARDAPRVGRNRRPEDFPSAVLQADTTAVEDARAGRGHDRVARSRRRAQPKHGAVLAGPAATTDAPAAVDKGDAAGAPAALGTVRQAQRLARQPGSQST